MIEDSLTLQTCPPLAADTPSLSIDSTQFLGGLGEVVGMQ